MTSDTYLVLPVVVDLPGKELRLIETTASVGLVTAEVAAVATPEALVQAADANRHRVLVNDRTYDMAVSCTGYNLPALGEQFSYSFVQGTSGSTLLAKKATNQCEL